MKGPALTLVLGSILLACSNAAPSAPIDADYILTYTDSAGVENAIPLPTNECLNFDTPLRKATYIALGHNPTNLYPARGCNGTAITLAPGDDYRGSTLILSVKRPATLDPNK